MLNDTAGTWAIAEHAIPALHRLTREPLATRLAAAQRTGPLAAEPAAPVAGVAVIPLRGLIVPFPSWLSILFGGGGGLQAFRAQLRDAVNNDQITAIVLNVDSPGGRIDLVPETAADLRAAREAKPLIAVANTMAASAAYWLASQADELVVTPSGSVGSIGTFILHESYAGLNEQLGVEPTYIVAASSPYKVDGNPDEPLSDSARQEFQDRVDGVQAMFVSDVAAGRSVSAAAVTSSFGQGRMVDARDARKRSMVDRVATLEETINRVAAGRRGRRSTRSQALADGDGGYLVPEAWGDLLDPPRDEQEHVIDAAETAVATPHSVPEAEVADGDAQQPDPAGGEAPRSGDSYGLETRRKRLSLVEHALD